MVNRLEWILKWQIETLLKWIALSESWRVKIDSLMLWWIVLSESWRGKSKHTNITLNLTWILKCQIEFTLEIMSQRRKITLATTHHDHHCVLALTWGLHPPSKHDVSRVSSKDNTAVVIWECCLRTLAESAFSLLREKKVYRVLVVLI